MNLLDWAQVAALALAGLFFLIKFAVGLFIVSLTLEPTASRHRVDPGNDVVIVKAVLTKGKSGSPVLLEETAVRCTAISETKQLIGIERLKMPLSIHDWEPDDKKRLRVPIGESMTTSCYFKNVPPDRPCVIEIVVTGRTSWNRWRSGQWRGSLVCPPEPTGPRGRDDNAQTGAEPTALRMCERSQ